ncbi:putative type IX sorting system protein PorV2 [Lutibacter citreus]|uniref:putative type IX sorting system protein PorV2 n=1 Tax=Lutibacter citreus TaxID=2138210 RepID=UPI000DBE450E|nr:PorV/PorQ family protein [Lutibacter citreus]
MKNYFIFLLFTTQLLTSQTVRKYSNEFLNIGVDAAAFGMSKAVVATSNDVNSTYWNPAGLTKIKDYEGAIMHANYFEGIAQYDYAGFAMPVDENSAVGIAIMRFGVDDILNTTELIDSEGNIDYNRISLFSAADYALNLSYARNLNIEGLSIGLNTKIVRRIIGDFATSWGFGLDAGFQYERENWKYGLMLRDITTTYNTWSIDKKEFEKIQNAIPDQNQELPETTEITLPKAQLGIARKFKVSKDFNLLSELDLNLRFTETNDIISTELVSIDPAIGFQLDYTNIVFLRAGFGNFQKEMQFDLTEETSFQPNFGIGFNYKGIQIDYALTNIGSVGNALYSNIFSIKVNFKNFK